MAGTGSARSWDPLQSLRQLLDQGERSLNEILAERSARDRNNAARSLLSRVLLDAQRLNWRVWGSVFETINLPTRTDVIRLGKTLAQLEQRLTQLENGLRASERAASAHEPAAAKRPTLTPPAATDRARPRRTRKPPSARQSEESR
jgi:hypothetical protein